MFFLFNVQLCVCRQCVQKRYFVLRTSTTICINNHNIFMKKIFMMGQERQIRSTLSRLKVKNIYMQLWVLTVYIMQKWYFVVASYKYFYVPTNVFFRPWL
jgi:hypothetical protein